MVEGNRGEAESWVQILALPPSWACGFPITTITDSHELNGSNQQNFIILPFKDQNSKMGLNGPKIKGGAPLEGIKQRVISSFFSSLSRPPASSALYFKSSSQTRLSHSVAFLLPPSHLKDSCEDTWPT